MRKNISCLILLVFVGAISACGPKAPTQEIADAQAALEAARRAGAENLYSDEYKAAEAALDEALARLRDKKYAEAKKLAEDAKGKADSLTERLKKLALPPVEPPSGAEEAQEPAPPGVEESTLGAGGKILTRETAGLPDDQLALKRIYFTYDEFSLSEEAKAGLRANSEWLLSNSTIRVQIEGHCDERGTNEYNLALGERRAISVRDYLTALGVPAERLAVISFGEELPLNPDHDEAAWRDNRRAQFVYLGQSR